MMTEEIERKGDVEKEDLLRLLACLQSELEAREEVINTLRLEKLHAVDFRAKYGFGNTEKTEVDASKDPFHALQRDSLVLPNSAHAEADLKPLYDTQLVQLENLITSQRRAQDTMREQLQIMEIKYLKVCKELEDERNKHERDAAQGDDVLVMLEKERERLKSEVEYERGINRKLEKDLRRVLLALREQALLVNSQRKAAVAIIMEHYRFSRNRKTCDCKHYPADASFNVATSAGNSETSNLSEQASERSECQQMDASVTSDDSFFSRECIRLRRLLSEEMSARKTLRNRFEHLQKEHQLLLNSYNKKSTCLDSTDYESSVALIDSLRTDKPSISGAPSSSAGPTQRPKPNPPMRRSSEITNTNSCTSSVNSNFARTSSPNSGSNINELAVHIESEDVTGNASSPDLANISRDVPVSVSVTLHSTSTSPVIHTSSRSSTPSPPPPPPPIQLHYPYPGMQSHVHHGQSRNLGVNSSFAPNTTRPAVTSVTHVISTKPRPTLTSHGSHPVNPPYQVPFITPSSTNQTSRMSFTSSTRGSVARRSPIIVSRPLQTDPTANSANYPTPFLSSQPKVSSVSHQQYPPRSMNHQHILSPTGGHHFPAYPTARQYGASLLSTAGSANARDVRSPVPPASSSLSSAGGPLGSGHVCINGK